jgi:hypothetical protein
MGKGIGLAVIALLSFSTVLMGPSTAEKKQSSQKAIWRL